DPVKKNLKKYEAIVKIINSYESKVSSLSDEDLAHKTIDFKERLANGETDQSILPETFAVVREVAKRTVNMRHFDVQLIGGIVLYNGNIAEMKTGEGKTLVATLPLYLNALQGKTGHLVTVNDYLAKRDREWMGPIYKFLGLTVGIIQHDSTYEERKKAYASDVTYGTNNEFGFDYLRDHMAINPEQIVQGNLQYAIVDEVDSILIDEARTPLIISGPSETSTDMYYTAAKLARSLIEDVDFEGDEKLKTVSLTPEGVKKIESKLHIDNLYEEKFVDIVKHINQALRSKMYFKKDTDYIVKEGEVVIVDEFTGRLMFGRRYSDGLHQAIEAKEGLVVKSESQTLATITFQNYFRMYKKLSGMTGTAFTERDEFREIYNLAVYVIPTNMPVIRDDKEDVIYKTERAKFKAIVQKVAELHKKGQPILVGTRSIETSERLSAMLKKEGISHNVLNAKYHEKEAMIIKDAGQFRSVTIATNMAGRGVDIKLGKGITDLGGLFILGTERHEARRIDNQLRGRSGRQGDPGASQFYLSLEDELVRIFGGDTIKKIFDTLKVDENEPIENKFLTSAIERAQKKVEAYNFSARKNLLDYDNVMEKQREVIYEERDRILKSESIHTEIIEIIEDVVNTIFSAHYNGDKDIEISEEEVKKLEHTLMHLINRPIHFDLATLQTMKAEAILRSITELAIEVYEEKVTSIGPELANQIEKYVFLRTIDSNWKEHLYGMDDLKEGIGLRAYGQQDPLLAYQKEGHELFDSMMERIKVDTVETLYKIQLRSKDETQKTQGTSNVKTFHNKTSESNISKKERQKRRALKKKLKKRRKG
ncbi:MAG: preprotein translocase subunit SecA, partial [Caldisericaceae bacterium]|nr:preprotein translocase subunit SecA [Caldisericaceae bacterium]